MVFLERLLGEHRVGHKPHIVVGAVAHLPGGVAVEVKRGKPPHGKLLEQIRRYASLPQVNAMILVVERTAELPHTVCGKPCRVVALNRLWGVAVG